MQHETKQGRRNRQMKPVLMSLSRATLNMAALCSQMPPGGPRRWTTKNVARLPACGRATTRQRGHLPAGRRTMEHPPENTVQPASTRTQRRCEEESNQERNPSTCLFSLSRSLALSLSLSLSVFVSFIILIIFPPRPRPPSATFLVDRWCTGSSLRMSWTRRRPRRRPLP